MKKYTLEILYCYLMIAGVSLPSYAVECPTFTTEEELRAFEQAVKTAKDLHDKEIFKYGDKDWFMPKDEAKIIKNEVHKHKRSHLKSITLIKSEPEKSPKRLRCYYEQKRENAYTGGEFTSEFRMTVLLEK